MQIGSFAYTKNPPNTMNPRDNDWTIISDDNFQLSHGEVRICVTLIELLSRRMLSRCGTRLPLIFFWFDLDSPRANVQFENCVSGKLTFPTLRALGSFPCAGIKLRAPRPAHAGRFNEFAGVAKRRSASKVGTVRMSMGNDVATKHKWRRGVRCREMRCCLEDKLMMNEEYLW